MAILLGLIIYDYGYLKIRAELSSMKEMEALKTKTLTKYVTLIAEKPHLEKTLTSSRRNEKWMTQNSSRDKRFLSQRRPSRKM